MFFFIPRVAYRTTRKVLRGPCNPYAQEEAAGAGYLCFVASFGFVVLWMLGKVPALLGIALVLFVVGSALEIWAQQVTQQPVTRKSELRVRGYDQLLRMLGGDHAKVRRLIGYEHKLNPKASWEGCIASAIERLRGDRD